MALQIKRKPGTVKSTFQKDGKNLGANPKPVAPGASSAENVSGDQSNPTQTRWGQGSSSSQIIYDPTNKQVLTLRCFINCDFTIYVLK